MVKACRTASNYRLFAPPKPGLVRVGGDAGPGIELEVWAMPEDRLEPFHVDFAFADFEQDSAHPVDWHRIDFIFVLFQAGNLLGGHDLAVTKISAIPPPPPEAVD